MNIKDFKKHWRFLEICNLIEGSKDKMQWHVKSVEGSWIPGISAGGSTNYIDTYHCNPQYRFHVDKLASDESKEEDACTVVIYLIQKDARNSIEYREVLIEPLDGYHGAICPILYHETYAEYQETLFNTTKYLPNSKS